MSNSSIEGRLKGLQERFENEMRIRSGFSSPGGIGAPRPGGGQRQRPRKYFASDLYNFSHHISGNSLVTFLWLLHRLPFKSLQNR